MLIFLNLINKFEKKILKSRFFSENFIGKKMLIKKCLIFLNVEKNPRKKNYRLQTTNYDHRLPTTKRELKSLITDYRLRTTNYNHRISTATSDYKLKTTTTDYEVCGQ